MQRGWLGLGAILMGACSSADFSVTGADSGTDVAAAEGGSDIGGDSGGADATDSASVDSAPVDAVADIRDTAPTGISVVQTSPIMITGFSTKVDPTLALATHPAPGNAVIVGITCFSEVDNCTIPTTGVTDSKGNTWLRVIEGVSIESSTTHGARGYIFIAPNIAPGTGTFTITVNPNGVAGVTPQSLAWGAIEVAGLVTTDPVDRTGLTIASCCSTSTTVLTTGATRFANELAVAVHTERTNDADVGYVVETGWTQRHVNSNGVSVANPHSMVTKVLTGLSVVSHTWGHDAPTRGASAIIATFKGR